MTHEKKDTPDFELLSQAVDLWAETRRTAGLNKPNKKIEGLDAFQPVIETQSRTRAVWEWLVVRLLRIT